MSDERDAWIRRIKSVEREYQACRFAVDRVSAEADLDPTILTSDLRPRDIKQAALLLEATYVLRLFAEFESGLRRFFQRARKRKPPSKTEDLLNSVAARHGIPNENLKNVHRVRDFRNDLIHERQQVTNPVPIKDARACLCTFFSFLPRNW